MSAIAGAIAESFRVLRPGGTLCIGTEDGAIIRGRLHSHYFPETVAVEAVRYPPIALLREAMTDAGFTNPREQRLATPYEVFSSGPYRDKAFSSLHLISDDAHRRGVARLERDLEAGPISWTARHLLLWGTRA
jgi:hypothetical protein